MGKKGYRVKCGISPPPRFHLLIFLLHVHLFALIGLLPFTVPGPRDPLQVFQPVGVPSMFKNRK